MSQKSSVSTTGSMMRMLFRTSSFERFREKNARNMGLPTFCEYINALCERSGEVRERVIKRSGLDRVYGHQIFSGRHIPSRDKVIQLAFGLGLDADGAQELLRVARKPELYPRVERDAALIYCLSHGKDFFKTQEMLSDLGLTMLGGDRSDR